MKLIVFSFLFVLFTLSASSAAKSETEQTLIDKGCYEIENLTWICSLYQVCSLFTEFEQSVKNCIEVKNGEDCGIGLGSDNPVSEDVGDVVKAFLTNTLASCNDDLQCILAEATSAKAEYCTASN